MTFFEAVLLWCLYIVSRIYALDNGLARTPPMGWLSWQRFRCITDCETYPDDCISEKLYMAMADRLVEDGYRDLGYKYVNIDDCWSNKTRAPDGSLMADAERFPRGIEFLADYMHNRSLKLGIYGDFGIKTCGGYPGSKFYEQIDAMTFAKWGVDSLKLDGCYTEIEDMDIGYPMMRFWLNQTGRPILYSCSWPAYVVGKGLVPPYTKIAENCNLWRNYADIGDNWDSVKGIIEFYGKDKGNFAEVAGPGNFNDPDMIILGNFGLSYEQQKVQMALWAIMAAPLYMSNDLRKISAESKSLLQNKNVIRINQDPLGIQGQILQQTKDTETWLKPMAPNGKSVAFAVRNLAEGGDYMKVALRLSQLGLKDLQGYSVTDVFEHKTLGVFNLNDTITVDVNPSSVFLGIAEPFRKSLSATLKWKKFFP